MKKLKTDHNGGVIIVEPKKEDARYERIFGDVGEAINWEPFLPQFERQGNTAFCLSFSRLNCAETLAIKDNLELNLSDKYLGVVSNTTKQGNSLNAVSEAFRKKGVVKEQLFKWTDEELNNPIGHWEKIMDISSIPADARRYYGGSYSWIKPKDFRNGLAHSPIQLAFGVYAETYNDPIVKKGQNITSYHAVMLYHIDENGNYHIFDSADGAKKILDKDYPIIQALSFRDLPENWKQLQSPRITLMQKIISLLELVVAKLRLLIKEETKIPVKITEKEPELKWGTQEEAIHSSRMIMDEYGLTWKEKALLCSIIMCESGFNIKATHKNDNGTTDFGIVMVNSYYWIGEDKKFPSSDYVLNNPEVCVRWMIKEYQRGNLKWWECYKQNIHQKYMPRFLKKLS